MKRAHPKTAYGWKSARVIGSKDIGINDNTIGHGDRGRSVPLSRIFATGNDEEMEDRSVNPLECYWTVFHSLRDKDKATARKEVFLVLQPQLYFSSEIIRVFTSRSEER